MTKFDSFLLLKKYSTYKKYQFYLKVKCKNSVSKYYTFVRSTLERGLIGTFTVSHKPCTQTWCHFPLDRPLELLHHCKVNELNCNLRIYNNIFSSTKIGSKTYSICWKSFLSWGKNVSHSKCCFTFVKYKR